jgi:hypothetical protein
MKTPLLLPILVACLASQSLAMKSRHVTFPQTCDDVWKASVVVAKSAQYRIISISREEEIISLTAGGAWWGERIISLSLEPGSEKGCTATVQSRYSGVEHSDGPDLLTRIRIRLIGEEIGTDSKAFQEFKSCVEHGSYPDWGGGKNNPRCEEKLRRQLEAEK